MTRCHAALVAALLGAAATTAPAQVKPDSLEVRTYPLRALLAADAAKLVAPYVMSPRGGVFDVGGARAITVREHPAVLRVVDSLLAAYDRAPAVVRLTFQIIETTEDPTRDPAIAPVESALRGLFRFTGYRLMAQTTSIVREGGTFHTTTAAGDRRFEVAGELQRLIAVPDPTIRLAVALDDLSHRAPDMAAEQMRAMLGQARILSTELTAPLGQTVVLGTGAPTEGGSAVILVLRAELAPSPGGR